MKKTIFTFLSLAFTLSVSAQIYTDPVWADFETGSVTALENIEIEGDAVASVVSNPNTGGINKSQKCLSVEDPATHQWWHKLILKPAENTVIKQASDNHVYFHFKCFRTRIGENSEVWLYDSQNQVILQKQFNNTKVGFWEDFVFDLSESISGKEVARIVIQPELNFNDAVPATTYLFDDFKLTESSYPEGVQIINVSKIVDFDNEALTAQNILEFKLQSADAKYEITGNPHVSDVNPSGKVIRYNKPANTTWWHSLQFLINGLAKVEYPNTYLHFMLFNPSGAPVEVMAEDHSGKQVSNEFYVYDSGEWEDFVLDLADLTTIKIIHFRFDVSQRDNWNNPAGIYYVDDVVLNDDFAPRETITSSIKTTIGKDQLSVYSSNGTIYVKAADKQIASVEIFSVNGCKVAAKNGIFDEVGFNLPKGTYLVKTVFTTGETGVCLIAV